MKKTKNISHLRTVKAMYIDILPLKILMVIAVFVSSGVVSFGQEMIRESLDFNNCDSSIVRQLSNDVTYVYNRTNRTSSFMKVTEGVVVCPSIYMEPLYINDFEMLPSSVYFCGYMIDEGLKKGIVGFFSLTTFPNVSIYYRVIDECTELKKLDIYRPNAEYFPDLHVVATGTTTGVRTDVLIDVTLFATPVNNCEIHFADGLYEYYDDVATTDNYVVVSTRDRNMDGTPSVNLWEYVRPTMTGMTIFNTSVNKKQITSPIADSPVLLEYTLNDEYSVVYKEFGYSRIPVMKTAIGSSASINAVDIIWLDSTVVPRDIKWDRRSKNYDVLTFGHKEEEYRTQIYHLPPAVFDGTAINGTGTRYSNSMLWSIDPCVYPYRSYMVSGSDGRLPMLCRYYYNYNGNCPDGFDYYYDKGKQQYKHIDEALPYLHWKNIPNIKFEPRKVDIPLPYICVEEEKE